MSARRTFAGLAWNDKKKVTRRERFLAEMNPVIPWAELVALIRPHYPRAGRGRPPIRLETMLRIYFLQQWFDLSDPAAEDALYDIESMRRFVGVELSDDVLPDEGAIQNGFTARFVTAAELIDDLSAAFRAGRLAEALTAYTYPDVLVVDEVGYLTYGTDAANMLFHVVNNRHRRQRAMIFTSNKPLNQWGRVLHDEDLAQAIVDRVLERGRPLTLDGPSRRTKHLGLDDPTAATPSPEVARISGIHTPEFPEPTSGYARPTHEWVFPIIAHKATAQSQGCLSAIEGGPRSPLVFQECPAANHSARRGRLKKWGR